MPTWTNNDGLTIKSGLEAAAKRIVWEYTTDGPKRMVEISLNSTTLPAVAANDEVIDENFKLPSGIIIEQVEVVEGTVAVDSAGDGTTINIGIQDADGGSNFTDVDGLVVEITQAEIATGGTNVAGWVGAKVGVLLTEATKLTFEQNTEALTAGDFVVRIYYSVVPKVTDTLGDTL